MKNIREIGIFMIAAQAVIHFAPGRQYEKYIKSVSGIIILLLFLRPFLQFSGVERMNPEAVLEKLEELTDMQGARTGETAKEGGVGGTVVSRMESELMAFLNRELSGEDYCVSRVSIRMERDSTQGDELRLSQIEIEMRRAAAGEESPIGIDRIVIGDRPDEGEDILSQYRGRFAALLEMEEERVEVRMDGKG